MRYLWLGAGAEKAPMSMCCREKVNCSDDKTRKPFSHLSSTSPTPGMPNPTDTPYNPHGRHSRRSSRRRRPTGDMRTGVYPAPKPPGPRQTRWRQGAAQNGHQ